MRYIILNTENNKSQGFGYQYTSLKPASTLDFRTVKDINGTEYDAKTPDRVISILERYRQNKSLGRIELDYGDTETGRSWGEVYDITGYVGRSTGKYKVPLLIYNSRSIGGGSILDHCIIRIREARGKKVLYQHPKYH